MKLTWRTLERGIYLLSIVGVIITWRADKARSTAIMETTVVNLSDDIKDINKKLERNEDYWRNQLLVTGRIIEFMESE